MRIYNGTKAMLDIPLVGSQRISIGPESVSKDFMPSEDFLKLMVTAYDDSEIALIVSGPYEVNMCAQIPALVTLTVQTIDQALERFQVGNPQAENGEKTVTDNKMPKKRSDAIEVDKDEVTVPKEDEETDDIDKKLEEIKSGDNPEEKPTKLKPVVLRRKANRKKL